MKKFYLMLMGTLLYLNSFAQFKGKVFSLPDSLPLAGASIQLPNGQRNASNALGEFSFTLLNGMHTISISHLAFEGQTIAISIPQKSVVSIYLMPKANQLSEVNISTGYQFIPKERATGSFTTITADKLNEQVGSDLINRLDGVASGFSVDRKTNVAGIMIRGLSSINGPRGPLIVLDNFPYEGNLDNLNPNDVESITILKDAAAASIWGARAGNGVIVITTKKGKFNTAFQLQTNAVAKVREMPQPEKLRDISVDDFIAVERFLFTKGHYTSVENSSNKAPLTPVVELLIAGRDGKISNMAMEEAILKIGSNSLNQQYKDKVYTNALFEQYSLGVATFE